MTRIDAELTVQTACSEDEFERLVGFASVFTTKSSVVLTLFGFTDSHDKKRGEVKRLSISIDDFRAIVASAESQIRKSSP